MRIKFKKDYQRKFIQLVMENSNCPSLGELSHRILVNYSSLKNYFSERRNLSEELFDDLCIFAKINKFNLNVDFLEENFGQVIGGKKSRKS